jgi:energy-coupling factor transport system substrate-specific component
MAESTGQAERGFFSRIASDFTTRAWVLIPVGVGINFVGGTLVTVLKLPIFLDTIGTILVALLAGRCSDRPHNEPGPGGIRPDLDRLRPG